ncbi:hypothetical protein HYR69_02725 [Candidatus Sumerlaeota bacterium]|nr:hypothetical protein [Candidatus Sumerlaeota bacterium]
MKLISHCVAIGLMFTAALITADEPVAFEKDVLPIFESRCAACHFPDADELKGNLDLSTFASALKGGKSGAVIVPGRGDESLLVKLIEGKADPQMPPKKFKPLKPEEIELIKKWINEGAKSDASAGPRKEIANASPAANDGPLKKAFKGLVKSAPKAEEKPQPPAPAAETAKDAPSASAANPAFQPISALAFSPAGDLLARGGLHKVDLLSVNPATGETKPLCVLDGHADLVRAVAFSPDGAFLAAAGGKPARKGEIKIWNVKDHSLVRTITGHKDNIYDVA